MEVKAVLYHLLLNFSFEPNEKTQIPMILKKFAFSLIPEKGMHLELKPRHKNWTFHSQMLCNLTISSVILTIRGSVFFSLIMDEKKFDLNLIFLNKIISLNKYQREH